MFQEFRGKQLFVTVAVMSLSLSQLSSWLIENNLARGATRKVTSFFYVTHVRNLGGIFGIMQGKGWLFGLVAMVLLILLLVYVFKTQICRPYEYICFGLILGGGTSNILDRLIYGSVIDFIDIKGIPYWKYIFNSADVFIHLGIWPMVLATLFMKSEPKSPVVAGYPLSED